MKNSQCHRCRPTVPMVVNEISRLFDERMRRTTTEPLQTQNSCRMLLRWRRNLPWSALKTLAVSLPIGTA